MSKELPNDIEKSSNLLFPVFLKLEQLNLLIIGGGKVALEKLHAVLSNSPKTQIKLVGKEIIAEVRQLANENTNLALLERAYAIEDFDGADLVIAAVNDIKVAEQIRQDAHQKNKLVNIADKPELCDFYLGSVVKKGNLKIAISTNGKSPTVAKRLRETFNEVIPAEIDEALHNMHIIRDQLKGDFEQKVHKLNNLTQVLVEKEGKAKAVSYRKLATRVLMFFAIMLIGHFIFDYLPYDAIKEGFREAFSSFDKTFLIMLAAGFLAQLVDGALGMGYGVTSTAVLLSAGISPAAISGSVHTAEMFASGASGYSHYRFGNVNKKLLKALIVPGVIGAILGAILLYYIGERYSTLARGLLAFYTMFLGIKILVNALKKTIPKKKFNRYGLLAGAGGFFDSFGGGGWGPIVTTTLIGKGRTPRFVIGTVSLTEFFVTFSSALTFFVLLGISHWQTILGLIIGGLLAAPIAARLVGRLNRKAALIGVGILVVIWSIRIMVKLVA